jgi:hypothetical protein
MNTRKPICFAIFLLFSFSSFAQQRDIDTVLGEIRGLDFSMDGKNYSLNLPADGNTVRISR